MAEKILLSSRFRYADRRLLFGRMRLYPDRITFSGIRWNGLHRRTVPLDDVVHLNWRTDTEQTTNLTLHLRDGAALRLWVQGGGLWKYQVEEHLGRPLTITGQLPEHRTAASAA